ncbi:replication protein A 32 kDa subunit A-like isoform X2 [Humulus lupulus]|uniref:replication protein A 32 kDa subunit A-like isoform X2 n=1 Tax=Humulus lupulus TaxID=3486 RepID=UPI002B411CD2|nr:replication protein A 32 kDa subunit A-like isoform X2 [Humulus lupulus]
MFSASQFDTPSAFSGAGFMSSQSSQLTDAGPSPAKGRDSHGLIPVTVKQISEAHHSGDEKSNFVINGVEAANVTLVGMVSDKTERNTDVSLFLDDGTGRIKCRRWVNENFDAREMEGLEDGMYVRVNGHLKILQGTRQLVAFSVRPVSNFDEISFHFIECIHNYLQSSKSQPGNADNQTQAADSAFSTPVKSVSNGFQIAPSSQLSGEISFGAPKGCDQLVLDYLQLPSSIGKEKGIHRDELSQQLKIPLEKIMESIRSLEDEGLIYSTIDEFHFKSAA